MILKGEEYSKRLETFSDSTMQLVSDMDGIDRETTYKVSDITAESEYSEEEVVRRLLELKKEVEAKS